MSKTEGIVIKEIRFKETSKILTIFTKELGKVSVMAKGAYKPKSRLIANTQLFSLSDYELYKGRSFYYINDGNILDSFYEIRENIDRIMIGSYFLELIDLSLIEDHPQELIFELLKKGLRVLTSLDGDYLKFLVAYELKFISFLGYRPSLKSCIHCNGPLGALVDFDPINGGVVCENCIRKDLFNYRFTRQDAMDMQELLMAPLDKLDNINIPPKNLFTVHNIMVKYILDKIDRNKFNSLAMYDGILSERGF